MFLIEPPIEMLTYILDHYSICNYITYDSYKKLVYYNHHIRWLHCMEMCYFKRNKHYATRDFTFNSFITILRHLAKFHGIHYTYERDIQQNSKHKKTLFWIKVGE